MLQAVCSIYMEHVKKITVYQIQKDRIIRGIGRPHGTTSTRPNRRMRMRFRFDRAERRHDVPAFANRLVTSPRNHRVIQPDV